MPIAKRQLAASIRTAAHIADRDLIAAFVLDEMTMPGVHNPFARTSVGTQRQTWASQGLQFQVFQIASVGLSCLLDALRALPNDEPLVQEILQSGPCRAYVYHRGDGCQIVGAVLHTKANIPLPTFKPLRRQRGRLRTGGKSNLQYDLFSTPS